jgi:hypothetical protein
MHPIYALWCHPRSMSTATERIMRTRGDLTVMHEPFLHYHYLGKDRDVFPGFAAIEGHPTDFKGTVEMIFEAAKDAPVFFKDMAYYPLPDIVEAPEFLAEVKHTFLVRDPAASIISYQKLDPDFKGEETGLQAQWDLLQALDTLKVDATVLRAEDIQRDPRGVVGAWWKMLGLSFQEHAFSWQNETPEDWKFVQDWHSTAIKSGGIRPVAEDRDVIAELNALGAPYTDYYQHHLPYYQRLCERAET